MDGQPSNGNVKVSDEKGNSVLNVDKSEIQSSSDDKSLDSQPSNGDVKVCDEEGNSVLKLEKDECILPEPCSSFDIVGRQVFRNDGVYIEGKIEDVKVTITADTGAARTIVSTKVYDKIHPSKRPKLTKSSSLASANGQPLVERGKAIFQLEMGDLILKQELVVAEIEDELLLGLDILMKGDMGPADLKLSEGVLELNGVTIPCVQIAQFETIRKVRAADEFDIPPQSEVLIDVFVDRTNLDENASSQDFLIEPSPQFVEKHPVVMASCLVDISTDVASKVRILNPFDFEVKINQDTVVGTAEWVESKPVVLLAHESHDFENFDRVKRINFSDPQPVTWQTNTGIIRNISKKGTADGGKSGVVSPHLDSLYTETVENHSPAEKEAIAALLNKYASTFSENDNDLGITKLVEHNIDTADAKPIKQPPRRVPMAFAEEEKKLITQMQEQGIIHMYKNHVPHGRVLWF